MRHIKFPLFVTVFTLSLSFFQVSAFADSNSDSERYPDDSYATDDLVPGVQSSAYTVSTIAVTGIDSAGAVPKPETAVAKSTGSGWGGTASSSGTCTATISTKFYSLLGTHMCTVRSGVYWEWSRGHVRVHHRVTPTLSTYNGVPLISIAMSYKKGAAYLFTWNGKSDGGWAADVTCYLKQAVFKYGVLGESQVNHLFKVQANGRYFWRATAT